MRGLGGLKSGMQCTVVRIWGAERTRGGQCASLISSCESWLVKFRRVAVRSAAVCCYAPSLFDSTRLQLLFRWRACGCDSRNLLSFSFVVARRLVARVLFVHCWLCSRVLCVSWALSSFASPAAASLVSLTSTTAADTHSSGEARGGGQDEEGRDSEAKREAQGATGRTALARGGFRRRAEEPPDRANGPTHLHAHCTIRRLLNRSQRTGLLVGVMWR